MTLKSWNPPSESGWYSGWDKRLKAGFLLNYETNNTALYKMYTWNIKLSFLGLKLHECLKKSLDFDGEVITTASNQSLYYKHIAHASAS